MTDELLTYEEICKLVRWVAPSLMPGIEREDIVQEAYLKYLEAKENPEKGGEKTWLVTKVVHCVRQKLRDEKRKIKIMTSGLPDSAIDGATEQDFGIESEHLGKQIAILYTLLDQQNDQTRAIVDYRLRGDTYDVIGAKLGISRVTVMKHWQRFKERLSRRLKELS